MPLPTAAELTDPNATNTQMKQRLGQLAENVVARDDIPQNLLFDPFNETVSSNKSDSLQCYRNAEFTDILSDSVNSQYGRPTLRGAGATRVARYFDVKKMGLGIGSSVYLRVKAFFTGIDETARLNFATYNSAATLIESVGRNAVTDVNDTILGPLTITSDTAYVAILVPGAATKELIACSISTLGNPKFVYGSVYADLLRSVNSIATTNTAVIAANSNEISKNTVLINANAENLMPDPFFRLYRKGVDAIDSYPLISETTGWSVVDYALSPFASKNALYMSSPTTAKNRTFLLKRFGLKVGDVLTFNIGISSVEGGTFSLGAFVRNAANSIIGTTSSTPTTLPVNAYAEAKHNLTITQEMLDSGVTLQMRLNVSSRDFTSGLYVSGWAIYKNNVNAPIRDSAYVEDELRLAIQEAKASVVSARPASYGLENLRETRKRLRALRYGITSTEALLSIAMIGDSWTNGADRYPIKVARSLWKKYYPAETANLLYGPSGFGYISFGGVADSSSKNGAIHWNNYVKLESGSIDNSAYGTAGSPDICSGVLSANSVIYLSGGLANTPDTTFTLFFEGGSGSVQWSFDNGTTWSDVFDLSAYSAGLQTYVIPKPVGSATSYNFKIKAATQCTLYGMEAAVKDKAGIIVNKLGATGTRAQHWAAVDATRWKAGIAALSPNLFSIMHGTNDQNNGRTKAQFKADVKIIMDRILSVNPAADIMLISACENLKTNNPISMSLYADAMYELAQEYHCAYVDLQPHFGATPADYNFTSSRPDWFTPGDPVHPNPETSGYAMADAYLMGIGEQGA